MRVTDSNYPTTINGFINRQKMNIQESPARREQQRGVKPPQEGIKPKRSTIYESLINQKKTVPKKSVIKTGAKINQNKQKQVKAE